MGMGSVGVVGVGATGRAVARRLLGAGFEVTVHDRDLWKVALLAAEGARPARIPADAAESADLVLVHVTDEAAVEEVLFDCGGVGDTLREGGTVVLTCRCDGEFLRSVAARLGAFGITTVEAAFQGDVVGGSAALIVGCGHDDLAGIEPVLEALVNGVAYAGPVGSVAPVSSLLTDLATLREAAPAPRPTSRARVAGGPVPPGVLTLQELLAAVGGGHGNGNGNGNDGRHGRDNCLGVEPARFEGVIAELERRCRIPLLREARQCRTPDELVALVNTQVTSGV
jgi:2-hydroxy-3-oxopropionate reductase